MSSVTAIMGLVRRPALSPLIPIVAATLTAVLALHEIGTRSFWQDEAFSLDAIRGGWYGLALLAKTHEINMVVYYALLQVWTTFGDSDAWIRSLSAIFAVGSVFAMFPLARELFGLRVATLATLLLGLNAFVIEYAQEARAYSLVLFLAIVATYLLVKALRYPRWWRWVVYVLVAVTLVYAHLFASGLLLVHLLMVLTYESRPAMRYLVGSAVMGAVLLAPALVVSAANAADVLAWVPPPSVDVVIRGLERHAGQGGPGPLGPIGGVLPAVFLVTALIAVWTAIRGPGDRRWAVLMVLAWVIVPILAALVVSIVKPIYVARYLIYVVPAISLLVAVGVDALPRARLGPAVAVMTVVLAANAVAGWYGTVPRPDWRAATAFILERGKPADRSVFINDGGRVVSRYARLLGRADELPLKLVPGLVFRSPTFSSTLETAAEKAAAQGRNIWVFAVGQSIVDPGTAPLLEGLRARYELVELVRFELVMVVQFRPRPVAS